MWPINNACKQQMIADHMIHVLRPCAMRSQQNAPNPVRASPRSSSRAALRSAYMGTWIVPFFVILIRMAAVSALATLNRSNRPLNQRTLRTTHLQFSHILPDRLMGLGICLIDCTLIFMRHQHLLYPLICRLLPLWCYCSKPDQVDEVTVLAFFLYGCAQ